jgi:RNA polymerase sigma factor (sigma-70 family)
VRDALSPEDRQALAWLATVIRRAGTRARRRHKEFTLSWDAEARDWALPVSRDPAARVVESLALREAWRCLTPQEREVVAATIVQGESQVSVAHRLGRSQARVSQIQAQALDQLRAMLELE